MRVLPLSAVCCLVAGAAVAAEPLPFAGQWDCGVAVFRFDADTYNNGSEDMAITDIAAEDGGYVLSFEDNYQLFLSLNPDGTLSWFSPVSGDSFTCTRQG